MRIETDHQAKLTAVWLTRAEQNDPALKDQLNRLYEECQESKHMVAVFRSGDRNLCQETGALLRHNLRHSAQLAGRRM